MNSPVKVYSKLKWTEEQEQMLGALKDQQNIQSWKIIASHMNHYFPQKNRSGKQCRERYMNYVRFGGSTPKIAGWSMSEDEVLFQKFMQHGAKWVQIGKEMSGRSENCLKNRFYGAMRKIIRKINRIIKEKRLRSKKPIKTELLIKILEHRTQLRGDTNFEVSTFLEKLKKEMITVAINPQENCPFEQIQSLIDGIFKFCALVKMSPGRRGRAKQDGPGFQVKQIKISSGDSNDSENQIQNQSQENEEIKSQDLSAKEEPGQGFSKGQSFEIESKACPDQNCLTGLTPVNQAIYKRVENFILVSSTDLSYSSSRTGIFFHPRPCQQFQEHLI